MAFKLLVVAAAFRDVLSERNGIDGASLIQSTIDVHNIEHPKLKEIVFEDHCTSSRLMDDLIRSVQNHDNDMAYPVVYSFGEPTRGDHNRIMDGIIEATKEGDEAWMDFTAKFEEVISMYDILLRHPRCSEDDHNLNVDQYNDLCAVNGFFVQVKRILKDVEPNYIGIRWTCVFGADFDPLRVDVSSLMVTSLFGAKGRDDGPHGVGWKQQNCPSDWAIVGEAAKDTAAAFERLLAAVDKHGKAMAGATGEASILQRKQICEFDSVIAWLRGLVAFPVRPLS